MIKRVEKQRHVTNSIGMPREVAAVVNKTNISNTGGVDTVNAFLVKNRTRKDLRKIKSSKFCDHCHKIGHEREQCFQLSGYPEWYDGPKGKKKIAGPRLAANVINHSSDQDTPLDEEGSSRGGAHKSTGLGT